MKRLLLCCSLILMTATSALAQTCIVNDPTGTPLNVRSRPNGPIVGALHNGVSVVIVNSTFDGSGKPWAFIVPLQGGKRGWVFRAFLYCGG